MTGAADFIVPAVTLLLVVSAAMLVLQVLLLLAAYVALRCAGAHRYRPGMTSANTPAWQRVLMLLILVWLKMPLVRALNAVCSAAYWLYVACCRMIVRVTNGMPGLDWLEGDEP